MQASVGDRLVVESNTVGSPRREGQIVEVREKQPFGGSLLVQIANREHALGHDLARSMQMDRVAGS